jgi:polyisoprenoid-binding protein YceI
LVHFFLATASNDALTDLSREPTSRRRLLCGIDAAAKTLKNVNVEIDASSLTTQFPKLTDHLKSPDFLEVREYPTINFESTKIEGEAGAQQITGNLTLHGVTKEITIPAIVDVVDGSPVLKSEFSIDRTEYGINFRAEQVEKKVSLTVTVGK